MGRFGVHEAKTRFSELLRRADEGEEIVILRGQEPVARLVSIAARSRGWLGMDAGLISIGADFDAPLPDDVVATFEG